jgi:hypothetical protein
LGGSLKFTSDVIDEGVRWCRLSGFDFQNGSSSSRDVPLIYASSKIVPFPNEAIRCKIQGKALDNPAAHQSAKLKAVAGRRAVLSCSFAHGICGKSVDDDEGPVVIQPSWTPAMGVAGLGVPARWLQCLVGPFPPVQIQK